MSAYPPPTKNQTIFNPSNFSGGLGADGSITIPFLNANYLKFPVAQANNTLAGTTILGNISHTGNLVSNGDINCKSIITSITETPITNDIAGLGIERFNTNILRLKTHDGNNLITHRSNNGSNAINATNQILMTISETTLMSLNSEGLRIGDGADPTEILDVLGNIKVTGNIVGSGNLVINDVNVINEIATKQDEINTGDLAITDTAGLVSALATKQDEINTGDLAITDTNGLEGALNAKYDKTGGTITGNATITGDLVVGTTNIIDEIGTKQDTAGLVSALATKQDEINTGDLAITDTAGLEGALNAKYDKTGGTITGNATITGSLTTNDLVVNKSLNIDNKITYEKSDFNTIVIRRLNEQVALLSLNEVQCWVNNSNLLASSSDLLTSYFANFNNNDIDDGFATFQQGADPRPTTNLFNEIFTIDLEARTRSINNNSNSIIIKNIPLTFIENIQSIILYNTLTSQNQAQGLVVELYNTNNDPTLSTPLVSTNEITTINSVYRFDFPSISTYPNELFVGENSGEFIVNDTFAETEVVSNTSNPVIINDNLTIGGDGAINLKESNLAGSATQVINYTNYNTLVNNVAGLESALTAKYDKTGGTITGNATITGELVVNNTLIAQNNSLSIDTRKYFDTIVIRRLSGITGVEGDLFISLRELQVWVDGNNILFENANILNAYFANFAVDKEVDLGFFTTQFLDLGDNPANDLFNGVINEQFSAHSREDNSTADIALIIKNIPLTLIENIQALVLYNRTGADNGTTIGLGIELYNLKIDPTLLNPLASTSEIQTAVSVYRFDFADIGSYSPFATGESLTNIIQEEDATTEVVSVADGEPTNVLGGLSVVGQISNPNKISFRAFRSGASVSVSTIGETLPFDGVFENVGGHYDTTTFRFTAPIRGLYLFYVSFSLQANQRGNVDFVRLRNEIENVEFQQMRGYAIGSVSANTASNTMSFTISVFAEVGDQFFPKLNEFNFVLSDNKRSHFGGYFIG